MERRRTHLTDNERRVLTVLSRGDSLTKRQISERGGISWATVVKHIARLEAEGFLQHAGMVQQPNRTGKDSASYALVPDFPLSVGIDIEYTTTRAVLAGLGGSILSSVERPTPSFLTIDSLVEYASEIVRQLSQTRPNLNSIVGVGIAVPAFIVPNERSVFEKIRQRLEQSVGLPVQVDDVSRAYALFKERDLFSTSSFGVVTIRSGLGLGISIGGKLYRGDENMSGELSHVVINPESSTLCPRCGHRGCLESCVNERLMAEDLLEIEDKLDTREPTRNQTETNRILYRLFERVNACDPEAERMLAHRARYLAHGISIVVMIMNIRRIFIAGHFGEHGHHLIRHISAQFGSFAPPIYSVSLEYEPLCDDGFAVGAAFLILRDYCNYEIP